MASSQPSPSNNLFRAFQRAHARFSLGSNWRRRKPSWSLPFSTSTDSDFERKSMSAIVFVGERGLMSGQSSHLMTYTDQQLDSEISDCTAALNNLHHWMSAVSISDRAHLDAKQVEFLQDRLRQLQAEMLRRQRKSQTPKAPAPSMPQKRSAVPPKSKPATICDEESGPPIIIRDADGRYRTWRPGDGRIHKPVSGSD